MRATQLSKAFLEAVDEAYVLDHFLSYTSGQLWTTTASDSGAATVETTHPGGVLLIHPSDGTVADNDETYVATTNAIFTIAAGQPFFAEFMVLFAEAATDDANLIIGFSSTAAANTLQDNGAGPPADYTGYVFFKTDGDTLWQCEVSNGTTQSTKRLTADTRLVGEADITAGSTLWQRLRVEVNPKSATLADITFAIDGKAVATFKDHVYTSALAVKVIMGCKNGGGTEDLLRVQLVGAGQVIDRQ